ncbi:MAG: four helix bundle protein [Candidatus Curtissbacteria bacterium]|nr:four helix bundle protein [Candidatus Curtissbacteria bacterium]
MGDFTKLIIWQKAHDLTIKVYALTKKLPKTEDYSLKSQLRRAAVSCESNIAEGETRYTDAAKINFFVDSRSSGAEVQSQLMIMRDVYPELSEESEALRLEYEDFCKQTNSLISFRRKSNLISQNPKNLTA